MILAFVIVPCSALYTAMSGPLELLRQVQHRGDHFLALKQSKKQSKAKKKRVGKEYSFVCTVPLNLPLKSAGFGSLTPTKGALPWNPTADTTPRPRVSCTTSRSDVPAYVLFININLANFVHFIPGSSKPHGGYRNASSTLWSSGSNSPQNQRRISNPEEMEALRNVKVSPVNLNRSASAGSLSPAGSADGTFGEQPME